MTSSFFSAHIPHFGCLNLRMSPQNKPLNSHQNFFENSWKLQWIYQFHPIPINCEPSQKPWASQMVMIYPNTSCDFFFNHHKKTRRFAFWPCDHAHLNHGYLYVCNISKHHLYIQLVTALVYPVIWYFAMQPGPFGSFACETWWLSMAKTIRLPEDNPQQVMVSSKKWEWPIKVVGSSF